MQFLENHYCQLEHYSFCDLTPSSHHYSQQVFIGDSNKYYSYIETYGDISSVKHRILELNKEWRHGNIHKQNQKNLILGLINRWGDTTNIALCNESEWYISGISGYTLESAMKKKQQRENFQNLKVFEFFFPYYMECLSTNIVSDEIGWQVIKEWLDTRQYTQYFVDVNGDIQTREYEFKINGRIVDITELQDEEMLIDIDNVQENEISKNISELIDKSIPEDYEEKPF